MAGMAVLLITTTLPVSRRELAGDLPGTQTFDCERRSGSLDHFGRSCLRPAIDMVLTTLSPRHTAFSPNASSARASGLSRGGRTAGPAVECPAAEAGPLGASRSVVRCTHETRSKMPLRAPAANAFKTFAPSSPRAGRGGAYVPPGAYLWRSWLRPVGDVRVATGGESWQPPGPARQGSGASPAFHFHSFVQSSAGRS